MPDFKKEIDEFITSYFQNLKKYNSKVISASEYSILNGGKRVRPQLVLRFLYDLSGSYQEALGVACALEMIHTYSLIHDDLPAMDNDDYRRNQLTCHKKFGEAFGILAGDALLTLAFYLVSTTNFNDEVKNKITNVLSLKAGCLGMILGQEKDILGENKYLDIDALMDIDYFKTGELFSASFLLASIINKTEQVDFCNELGHKLGLAFQIQDDILDVTKNLKKQGEVSSDLRNNKSTYVTALGLEESKVYVNKLYDEIIYSLESLNLKHHTTIDLIKSLRLREL